MAELILHLGAHGTDNGTIAAWLERNAAQIASGGTLVMPARQFLQRLSQLLADLGDAPGDADRRALADALGLGGQVTRVAVSAPALLGPAADVITAEGFYARDPTARLRALGRLLPADMALTLALAIARPGALLPRLLAAQESTPDPAMIAMRMGWLGHETLPWVGLVRQIRRDVPGARLVVWRNESLGAFWPDVLSLFAGYPEDAEHALPVDGAEEFAMQGIVEEGRERMRRYIAAKPPTTAALMQRVAAAFAQGYGRLAYDAADIAGPGFAMPARVQEQLTRFDEAYAAQWWAIAATDGVEVLG